MGGHQNILRVRTPSHGHHNGSVTEAAISEIQLDKIARFDLRHGGFSAEGALIFLFPHQKIPKILHAAPCRRFIVGVAVIPPERGRKIHDARPGIEALRGKIGAVPSDVLVVVVTRVPAIGPLVRIGHGTDAIVWKCQHTALPFPKHCMPDSSGLRLRRAKKCDVFERNTSHFSRLGSITPFRRSPGR